jgi:hypothetical protein
MLKCGNREFKTWEEAKAYIDEWNMKEKERKEAAFYYWHNMPIEGIINVSVAMGVNMTVDLSTKMNVEDKAIKEMIIDVTSKKIFNDIIGNIDMDISKEIHAGNRMLLLS